MNRRRIFPWPSRSATPIGFFWALYTVSVLQASTAAWSAGMSYSTPLRIGWNWRTFATADVVCAPETAGATATRHAAAIEIRRALMGVSYFLPDGGSEPPGSLFARP